MRIIDAGGTSIRAVAISPDGQLVAAAAEGRPCALYHWAAGTVALPLSLSSACDQFAFPPGGRWMAHVQSGELWFDNCSDRSAPGQLKGPFAGGVAASPDGKVLVAARAGVANYATLARWSLPGFQPLSGFDFWSPFRRLAFSPNGEFLAGIWAGARRSRYDAAVAEFELRFAHSGGLDYRHRHHFDRALPAPGFVGFTRDSSLCAFGWQNEFHVLDLSTGTSRYARRVEASFRDAAFTGSGRHLATADDSGRVRLWDARTWQVAREYDWGCGALTCLTFTADGSAGVCGTADGRLVQFDLDE
jgi:WD40 repeat protein